MTIKARHPSELKAQYLSNNSLDPWVDVNSGPRKVMFAGHLPQSLVIHGSEERYWQTGAEARFGEYCFNVSAPTDMEVIRVIDRYPRSRTIGSAIQNPQKIVIYIDLKSPKREIGCLDLKDYNLEHQYFGFKFNKTKEFHRLAKGECFEEGTPFLISPSIKEGGGWAYGVNLMFANMSHPAGAEDGILIGKTALKKMSFDLIESRVVSWGQNRYGVNMFGDLTSDDPRKRYRMFKDMGEYISPDGLLCATRAHDERLCVTNMGLYDTMMLDMTYDDKTYCRPGEGKIIDILMHHDNRSLPNGMNAQAEYYRDLTDRFYREILEVYEEQYRARRGNMYLTDEFHQLVLEACGITDYDIGEVVQKLHHKVPIDDWRAEFKVQYTITPFIGNKATGCAGD